jgi:hypothetical protein
MCHGYEMRWWRSERKTEQQVEKTKSEAIVAAQRAREAKEPLPKAAEEKELTPAE